MKYSTSIQKNMKNQACFIVLISEYINIFQWMKTSWFTRAHVIPILYDFVNEAIIFHVWVH